jgi:predicted Zn finger-like uncharacterized protein
MIVLCDKCGTQYNLDDARIKPGETKVRCSQCQYVFTIPQPLTLDEGEIFGETGQQTEDAFMKEWAKEFTPSSSLEPRQPAPAAPDKASPPRAFAPPAAEEALLGEEAQTEGEAEVSPFRMRPTAEAPRKKKRTVSTTFLLTILLLVIVTGALYYWSQMGHSVFAFEYIYEKMYDFMGGEKQQKLFVLYLKGSEHTLQGGKVFAIQGKVANRSKETKKFVKVKGSLFDKAGKVVAASIGYCGITSSDEEIEKSTLDTLKSSFGFPAVGQAKPVPPQQSLPFTIIFFSPPEGASQYQVEIAEVSESG